MEIFITVLFFVFIARCVCYDFSDPWTTCLDLEDNDIRETGSKLIAEALKNTPAISLNLKKNWIRDEGLIAIAPILPATNITHLNLARNGIGPLGAKALAQILEHTQITVLDLGFNQLEQGADFIMNVLNKTQIVNLNLEHNHIKTLGSGLKNTRIEILNLEGNQLDEEVVKGFAEVLNETKIMELNLDGTGFGISHLEISNLLYQRNEKKRILRFEGKYLTDEGLESMVNELAKVGITHLSLRKNLITQKGARTLAKILRTTNLTFLDLGLNDLGYEGIKSIAEVLKYTRITELIIDGNSLGHKGTMIIVDHLRDTKITHLNLANNRIKCLEMEELARVLRDTRITDLDLGSNEIETRGALALARVLKETQIVFLNLDYNQRMRNEAGRALLETLKDAQIVLEFDFIGIDYELRCDLSVLVKRNKVQLHGLYQRFRNLVTLIDGRLVFRVRDEEFVDIVVRRREGYVRYFMSEWDVIYTNEQVTDFIWNIERIGTPAEMFYDGGKSVADWVIGSHVFCSLVAILVSRFQ